MIDFRYGSGRYMIWFDHGCDGREKGWYFGKAFNNGVLIEHEPQGPFDSKDKAYDVMAAYFLLPDYKTMKKRGIL